MKANTVIYVVKTKIAKQGWWGNITQEHYQYRNRFLYHFQSWVSSTLKPCGWDLSYCHLCINLIYCWLARKEKDMFQGSTQRDFYRGLNSSSSCKNALVGEVMGGQSRKVWDPPRSPQSNFNPLQHGLHYLQTSRGRWCLHHSKPIAAEQQGEVEFLCWVFLWLPATPKEKSPSFF